MKINYRPEIDGLRAIAVSIVILYHAKIYVSGIEIFKGGFLGVDIFFVISGYLITSILFQELQQKGTISFSYFYQRRVRRILPALFFIMFVSFFFAWKYLLPSRFIEFSESIISSVFFASNFYFHFNGMEYAAQDGLLKPFLHTWSLSVEEQFYLVFPLLFLISYKFFKNRLILIFAFLALISFFYADWGSKNFSSATFYLIHSRIWELLAGSLLVICENKFGRGDAINIKYKSFFPSIGLLVLTLSFFLFDENTFHPSFLTIFPIVGVCLIIFFSNSDEIITKILSSKLFVGIGLISYSLYLWHYPIFAFARITGFVDSSLVNKIVIGLLVLLLSIFTFFAIERPARKKSMSFKYISILISIFFFLILFLNTLVIKNYGFKNRVPEFINKNIDIEQPMNLLKNEEGEECMNNPEGCLFNTKSKRSVYLIGDSHMASIASDLTKKLIEKDYSVKTSMLGNCLFFPGFDKFYRNEISNKCLNSHFQNLIRQIKIESDPIIIFSGRLPLYISGRYFDNNEGGIEGNKWEHELRSNGDFRSIEESFKISVDHLAKDKGNVILIYPIPEVGWDVPSEILKRFFIFNNQFSEKNFVTTSYELYKERTKSTFKLLDEIKGNNIYRVYPHKLFCDTFIKSRCITHNKDYIFYADDDHPSIKGSIEINNLIIKEIENIENNKNY